jgi:hypothetical protein
MQNYMQKIPLLFVLFLALTAWSQDVTSSDGVTLRLRGQLRAPLSGSCELVVRQQQNEGLISTNTSTEQAASGCAGYSAQVQAVLLAGGGSHFHPPEQPLLFTVAYLAGTDNRLEARLDDGVSRIQIGLAQQQGYCGLRYARSYVVQWPHGNHAHTAACIGLSVVPNRD